MVVEFGLKIALQQTYEYHDTSAPVFGVAAGCGTLVPSNGQVTVCDKSPCFRRSGYFGNLAGACKQGSRIPTFYYKSRKYTVFLSPIVIKFRSHLI
jgi:hypothetical protein